MKQILLFKAYIMKADVSLLQLEISCRVEVAGAVTRYRSAPSVCEVSVLSFNVYTRNKCSVRLVPQHIPNTNAVLVLLRVSWRVSHAV